MKPVARIINATTTALLAPRAEQEELFGIYQRRRANIPGWTDWPTFLFFKSALDELFRDQAPASGLRLLIAGVYHGLDLALIADLAERYHRGRDIALTGVDLFSAEPCADWPAEKRHLTWQEAFNCPPPSIEAARRNCPSAEIVQADATTFLNASPSRGHTKWHESPFHWVHIDTSHDEKTCRGEIAAAVCTQLPGTLLTGDDYTGPGNFACGVAAAVEAMLPTHHVLFNRTWLTQL
jgi:hypothetical protein